MSGIRRWYGHEDGKFVLGGTQDVEPILEDNKRLQTEPQSRTTPFRHIARIPNVILERWFNEELARGNVSLKWGGKEFDAIVKRKLQDPDWKFLRTDSKQVFL